MNFLAIWRDLGKKQNNIIKGEESNMLVVRHFLSFIMVAFYLGIEARMVEGETRFNFVPESGVESSPYWSKTSNGSNIEKHVGYHPITKLKYISRTFPKIKGRFEHVGIVPWPNSW